MIYEVRLIRLDGLLFLSFYHNSQSVDIESFQANFQPFGYMEWERRIDGTTYIVSYRFNERAKEEMAAKVKRLITSGGGQ